MAVGELLIVCDMGDKVEMSSGQNFPRAGTRLRHLAPAGQIRGHWEHDDPHDITRRGAVDSVDTRSSLGGREKNDDGQNCDNHDEDIKSQVTRLCSRASKSPRISLCNNCS